MRTGMPGLAASQLGLGEPGQQDDRYRCLRCSIVHRRSADPAAYCHSTASDPVSTADRVDRTWCRPVAKLAAVTVAGLPATSGVRIENELCPLRGRCGRISLPECHRLSLVAAVRASRTGPRSRIHRRSRCTTWWPVDLAHGLGHRQDQPVMASADARDPRRHVDARADIVGGRSPCVPVPLEYH
jgi:hypothetical protein